MKTQRYFPSRMADQIPWLENFSSKLADYETPLSLPSAHVDACVASCKYLVYVLGQWLPEARALGTSATSTVDLLCYGSGPDAVTLPVFNPPALPTGVAAVPPGALNRLFDLVQIMKKSTGYTEAIGRDLDIIGPEVTVPVSPEQATPGVRLNVERGQANEAVRINFIKRGHQGVYIECQRANGAWEFLGIDTEEPYLDDRPLLVAGTPEVRKYRLRFWDKGTPNGDWSDIATITVSP